MSQVYFVVILPRYFLIEGPFHLECVCKLFFGIITTKNIVLKVSAAKA